MKRFIISTIVFTTLATFVHAGPMESQETKVQQSSYQNSQDWYRDREWNFDLFGAYAFTTRPYRSDRYLGADHALGGGIAASYMFSRYLGAGVEGYALAADDAIGQASGNLIFRYPIPGSRIAPYGFVGGGVIFNGSQVEDAVDRDRSLRTIRRSADAEAMGQFGLGFEVRVTPNIGVINDVRWNVVNGDRNDFGMVRSGVRFAF